jgi:hypothetical protein
MLKEKATILNIYLNYLVSNIFYYAKNIEKLIQ